MNDGWHPSIGEKFWLNHRRNGHFHEECDPLTGKCSTHYDQHDPYESPVELIKHLADSKLVQGVVVLGVIDHLFNDGKLRKKAIRTLFG